MFQSVSKLFKEQRDDLLLNGKVHIENGYFSLRAHVLVKSDHSEGLKAADLAKKLNRNMIETILRHIHHLPQCFTFQ